MLRRVAAVFAGFLAVVSLSLVTDAVLHATGVFQVSGGPPRNALLVVAMGCRILYTIAGSYIAARLAPDRPMAHALALGTVIALLSIAGAVVARDRGLGSLWFTIALIAIAIPCAWAGGRLRTVQVRGAERVLSSSSRAARGDPK